MKYTVIYYDGNQNRVSWADVDNIEEACKDLGAAYGTLQSDVMVTCVIPGFVIVHLEDNGEFVEYSIPGG